MVSPAMGSRLAASIASNIESPTLPDSPVAARVPTSTSTIAPYHSDLNGVNQPLNMELVKVMWWTLGGLGALILLLRFCQILWSETRRMMASPLPAYKMQYFRSVQWSWVPGMKSGLLYAPLWKKRHNREFKLSEATNMGTLPGRLQAIILGIWLLSNFAYMFILDWTVENKYAFAAEIRGRSGTLSVVNMVPLVILAGRNNPLISLLRISFDTYNLLHRWMGRLAVVEAVIHTAAWAFVQVADGGWAAVRDRVLYQSFEGSGMIGTFALILILIISFSPVRHAFYESFLNMHIFLALVVFVAVLIHCDTSGKSGGLPQLPWMVAILTLWGLERFARVLRIAYLNFTLRNGLATTAVCEALPGDATRVTMLLPRYVDVKPGSHCYLRFAGISPLASHPFSVAWVDHVPRSRLADPELAMIEDDEKKPIVALDRKNCATSLSFVVGAHTGFTRRLFNATSAASVRGGTATFRAMVEGPYAGHNTLDSYGHVVLFAGATGITHQLSYLRPLIEGYNAGTVAVRRITLVWIVRDYAALEWTRIWINQILRMPNRRDVLRIQVFVTRPSNPREIVSASATVQMFPGRPSPSTILRRETEEQFGAMCVSVCGPGSLADDVRQAVRASQSDGTVVDFLEESFTW